MCLPLLAFVERLAIEAEGETSPLGYLFNQSATEGVAVERIQVDFYKVPD